MHSTTPPSQLGCLDLHMHVRMSRTARTSSGSKPIKGQVLVHGLQGTKSQLRQECLSCPRVFYLWYPWAATRELREPQIQLLHCDLWRHRHNIYNTFVGQVAELGGDCIIWRQLPPCLVNPPTTSLHCQVELQRLRGAPGHVCVPLPPPETLPSSPQSLSGAQRMWMYRSLLEMYLQSLVMITLC